MIKRSIESLVGEKLSAVLGYYFKGMADNPAGPSAIIFPVRGHYLALEADGNGAVRERKDILETIYYDADLGYSFVGSVLISLDDMLDGDELIKDASMSSAVGISHIKLDLEVARTVVFRFEDDEIYCSIEDRSIAD